MNSNTVNNADCSARKSAKAFKVASAALIVSALATGSIAFATSFQPEARYFTASPLVWVLYALLVVAVIFSISAPLIFKRREIDVCNRVGRKIFSLLTAAASTIPFIYYIYSDLTARAAASVAPSGSVESFYSGLDGVTILVTVTSLFVVIFSLSIAFNLNKTLTLISGYGQVVFCAAIITKLYLDFSVELNSPIKLLLQFSAAAVMIGTVNDLRVFADKPQTAALISSKFMTALICLLNFAGFVFEVAPNIEKYGYDYAAFSILFLFYGIASAFTLFMISTKSPSCEELAEEIADVSTETQAAEVNTDLPAEPQLSEDNETPQKSDQ